MAKPNDPTPAGEDQLEQETDLEDFKRTPGDGSLDGAVPPGLGVDELRRRAEDKNQEKGVPGTG